MATLHVVHSANDLRSEEGGEQVACIQSMQIRADTRIQAHAQTRACDLHNIVNLNIYRKQKLKLKLKPLKSI